MNSSIKRAALVLALLAGGAPPASARPRRQQPPAAARAAAGSGEKAAFVRALREAVLTLTRPQDERERAGVPERGYLFTPDEAQRLLEQAREAELLRAAPRGMSEGGFGTPRIDISRIREEFVRRDEALIERAEKEGEFILLKKDFRLTLDEVRTQTERVRELKAKQFISLLPRDGDHYVVEGDLRMIESEVRRYLSDADTLGGYYPAGELPVNQHAGADDYYRAPEARKLTYSIDHAGLSAEQFEDLAEAMSRAARDWQETCPSCGVEFSARPAGAPPANFVVRQRDAKGVYAAAGFFPHAAPEQRVLNIDPSFFSAGPEVVRAGILRHQLGHILGYRHAAAREPAGCYGEGGTRRPVSNAEPPSVMQYFCSAAAAGMSSGDPTFAITQMDAQEHEQRYGPALVSRAAGSEDSPDQSTAVIRLHGGHFMSNVALILSVLKEHQLLKVGPHVVTGADETVLSIYRQKLRLPALPDPEGLLKFADDLNERKLPRSALAAGEAVPYPENVRFDVYRQDTLVRRSDARDQKLLADVRRAWPKGLYDEFGSPDSDIVRLRRHVYELRLFVGREAKASAVLQSVSDAFTKERTEQVSLALEGVVVNSVAFTMAAEPEPPADSSAPPARQEATPVRIEDADKFPDKKEEIKFGVEWRLGSLVKMPYPPPEPKCGRRCPEVILIDQAVLPHADLPVQVEHYGVRKPRPTPLPKPQDVNAGTEFEVRKKVDKSEVEARGLEEHGTYMAGIIASQMNDFGLIGVYPHVRITSVEWKSYNPPPGYTPPPGEGLAALATLIENRLKESEGRPATLRVFVLATQFPYGFSPSEVSDRHDSRTQNPLAKFIKTHPKLLWVVAAGQQEEKTPGGEPKNGEDIHPNYSFGPMNLGDLPNVITVTAVESMPKDDEQGATLFKQANRPQDNYEDIIIHVAAPGNKIPGTVLSKAATPAYAVGDATSPATAIAAGVVLAMYSHWPDNYDEPYKLKTRLQVTARSFFDLDDPSTFIHAGLIDADLALKDPELHWFKGSEVGSQHESFSDMKWLQEHIRLERGTEVDLIRTDDIYRIYRLKRKVPGGGGRDENLWVIYTRKRKRGNRKVPEGIIERYAPGEIKRNAAAPLLSINGKNIYLAGLSDLVLARPVAAPTPDPTDKPIQSFTDTVDNAPPR